MQSVLISIHSNAYRDDSPETEAIDLLVPGSMEISGDGTYAELHYEETVEEGGNPEFVSILVLDDSIHVTREGEYTSSLYFQMGNRHLSEYQTPAGRLELAIYCTFLKIDLNENGGNIELNYQVDINGQFVAMHEMRLDISAEKKSLEAL